MPKRDRMSAMDATMLYLENRTVSFDMAGLFRVDGPIDFDDYVNDLGHRLEHLPRFRQRILFVPFNLGHPTWQDDPEFKIENHVRHIRIPAPGGDDELDAFLESVMQDRLDMSRPPWMAYVLNGLENDNAAVMIKVHHCMTDGTGGHKVYAALVNFQDAKLNPDPPPAWNSVASPLPGGLTRTAHAVIDAMRGGSPSPRAQRPPAPPEERARRKALLTRFRKAPSLRYSFNGLLSGGARHRSTSFPLKDLRDIRAKHGGTVNDVLLTMLGDVMARVARDEGQDHEGRYLKVHLAANRRTEADQDTWGNRVSLLPALVPLGDATPDQLQAVNDYTREAKDVNVIENMEDWIYRTQRLPAPFLSQLLRIMFSETFNRFILKLGRPPAINLYLTNVRWPEISSYMGGRNVTHVRPVVPLMPGIGLICSAITYDDQLYVCFSGDPTLTMPLDKLIAYLHQAFERLQAASSGEFSAGITPEAFAGTPS
jgi:diacylglycerol O-acyltransferase / wax synthase